MVSLQLFGFFSVVILLTVLIKGQVTEYFHELSCVLHIFRGKGKYTIESSPKPDGDPCTYAIPGDSNSHLKWHHGRPKDGKRYYLPYNSTLECKQDIYYNKDGFYIGVPNKPTEDKCYIESMEVGYYIYYHGQEVPESWRTDKSGKYYEPSTTGMLDELLGEHKRKQTTKATTPATMAPTIKDESSTFESPLEIVLPSKDATTEVFPLPEAPGTAVPEPLPTATKQFEDQGNHPPFYYSPAPTPWNGRGVVNIYIHG